MPGRLGHRQRAWEGREGPHTPSLPPCPPGIGAPGLSSGWGTADGGLVSGRVGLVVMTSGAGHSCRPLPRHPVGLGSPAAGKRGLGSGTECPGFSDWVLGTLGSCPLRGLLKGGIRFCPLRLPRPPAWKPSYRSLGSGDHLWERASSGLEIAKCAQK